MTSTRSKRIKYVAAIVVAQLTVGLLAQDSPTTIPASQPAPATATTHTTRQNGNLVLNFQDVDISSVLSELSATAGFIVVNDRDIRPTGKITLVSKQPITPEEAVALLNTVLRNNGYAAIQQDRILKIVNKDAAKRQNIPVRSGNDPLKIANTDELITQVIPLRYADATQLKNDLQPLVSTEADFTANASSNALVITDTSANVRRLVQIVAALDTSLSGSVEVRVFQLKYATAADAAKLVETVFGDLDSSRPQQNSGGDTGGGGGGNGGGRGGFGGGPGGFGGGPGGFGGGFGFNQRRNNNSNSPNRIGKVTAGADQRTNSIVVTGPSDLLTEVDRVVKQLDSNPASEESVYVYKIKNGQSANIESVINGLFNGTSVNRSSSNTSGASQLQSFRQSNSRTSSSSGSTGTRGGTTGGFGGNTGGRTTGGFGGNTSGGGFSGFGGFGGTGGTNRLSAASQQNASDLAGKVSIIADTDSNSLLVRTSPANYPRVKQILDELDRPVQQVLIKVLLAEVSHDNGSDIGAELSGLNLRTTNTPGVTDTTTITKTNTVGATGNQTVTQNVNSVTNTTAAGTSSLGLRGGGGFNIPVTGANATGLVVQLLENNFQATIRALETTGKLDVLSRPYILASDNQIASITVGEEVPFITRTQVTDTGTLNNTIEYRDIGILLDVIPHINPDGLVIMDVAPEISTLGSEQVPISNNVFAPTIKKRSAQSRVAVKSGQTVVIGGLMEDRLTESVDKVPLLGDIPILGEAFKRTIKNKTKTELLIFLTPHVAANPDALTGMSKQETDGTKLTPKAIGPGVYEEHQDGLRRGEDNTTQPTPKDNEPEERPDLKDDVRFTPHRENDRK